MADKVARHSIHPPWQEREIPVEVGEEMAWIRQFLGDRLHPNHKPPDDGQRRSIPARLRYRFDRWRMPYVTTTDFDDGGVRFEVATPTERYRIVDHADETDYMRLVLSLLRPEDVLYDVGVCVGLVALHAARRCRVVDFEPDPYVRARFDHNLALNPDLSVELYDYAIGDIDGSTILHLDPGTTTSASLRRQQDEPEAVEVEVRTLDTLVFDDDLPTPTAIELDIEGAELPALRGAERLLSSDRRPSWLFLELHPAYLPAFGGTADDVLDLVDEHPYRPRHAEVRGGQIHIVLESDPQRGERR